MAKPLCFIAMPFGKKLSEGRSIDFDAVWRQIIAPAIEMSGMQPLRADEEQAGGIIHKPMFERLLLCDYVICDLTFANANVFYELGIRHAARPHTTLLVMADDVRLPFDVAMLRALPYGLNEEGTPKTPQADAAALSALLSTTRQASRDEGAAHDSPLYQLLDGIEPLQVDSDKTDVFREQVAYSDQIRRDLDKARKDGPAAVTKVRAALGPIDAVESGVAVDIMLSFRAVEDWQGMIDIIHDMPLQLRRTVMVREQLGFALNRAKRRADAEKVLRDLVDERGPSSETLGLLGRVYKDRWEDAAKAGETAKAKGLLRKAIRAYEQGFETDWRDHYPGINAVTLMELQEPPNDARHQLIPVVRYSVERRIKSGDPDYWDWATLLELEVLGNDHDGAYDALAEALTEIREAFEPKTTRRNLRLIREARQTRGEDTAWINEIEQDLADATP